MRVGTEEPPGVRPGDHEEQPGRQEAEVELADHLLSPDRQHGDEPAMAERKEHPVPRARTEPGKAVNRREVVRVEAVTEAERPDEAQVHEHRRRLDVGYSMSRRLACAGFYCNYDALAILRGVVTAVAHATELDRDLS